MCQHFPISEIAVPSFITNDMSRYHFLMKLSIVYRWLLQPTRILYSLLKCNKSTVITLLSVAWHKIHTTLLNVLFNKVFPICSTHSGEGENSPKNSSSLGRGLAAGITNGKHIFSCSIFSHAEKKTFLYLPMLCVSPKIRRNSFALLFQFRSAYSMAK